MMIENAVASLEKLLACATITSTGSPATSNRGSKVRCVVDEKYSPAIWALATTWSETFR